MLADGVEIFLHRMHAAAFDLAAHQRDQQRRQASNMVEMGMRKKNVDLGSGDSLRGSKKTRAGVEQQADLRQHYTRGMSPLVGEEPSGSKKLNPHSACPPRSGLRAPCEQSYCPRRR